MLYRINKQKCLGIKNCGICQRTCPGATKEGEGGKAEIVDQKKLEECGGEQVCPMGAIEKEGSEEEYSVSYQPFLSNEGGAGRGMGAGKGRGLGKGPRDGRGQGRGGKKGI
ncbi:MAG: hypothetical protein PHU82_02465 [Candidatus Pacebacteria bacterium]|nr:hypothetical protein [Candidatus Paceibacterota bacterium]